MTLARGSFARMTRYHHVDVFADAAYTGNSLAVFLDPPPLRAAQMLAITREGRHWNNDGLLEDVATGSAAGCVAGYLRRHQRIPDGEPSELAQGRFTGRPSRITITAYGAPDAVSRVTVGGAVTVVGEGTLHTLPGEERVHRRA